MLNSVLIFLDMSGGEMILIALVALLVLGPQKMSEVARKAGKMMSEVKRVSSDFTSQLNEETASLREEVKSVKETLKDTAFNIKEEVTKQTQGINSHLNTEVPLDSKDPAEDLYHVLQDPTEKESHPGIVSNDVTPEQSDTQHVSKEQHTDINPTSKQENNP
jgi:Tat protein translocase TatB subunit